LGEKKKIITYVPGVSKESARSAMVRNLYKRPRHGLAASPTIVNYNPTVVNYNTSAVKVFTTQQRANRFMSQINLYFKTL
jgi:hypothetical protein